MDDRAAEARPLLVLGDRDHLQLGMGEGLLQHGARHLRGRPGRPLAPAGEAAGEDEHVVGVVGDGEGVLAQIVEGERRAEGRDHQMLALLDQAERRDMHGARTTLRDHDASRGSSLAPRLALGRERGAGGLEARQVLRRPVDGAAPVQRLVLHIALAEPPGDLGLGQFEAEIEGMAAVALDAEAREEVERDRSPTWWPWRL